MSAEQQEDKNRKLLELENSEEIEEYFQWCKWAQLFYKRILPKGANFKDTFKIVEEGYLKTNPKAKEYLELVNKPIDF